jgi:hypothetical protein
MLTFSVSDDGPKRPNAGLSEVRTMGVFSSRQAVERVSAQVPEGPGHYGHTR